MTDTLTDLIAYRDHCRQQADDLIERYGTGVRPSWVSTDLAIYWHRAEQAQLQIDELESGE